MSHIVYPVSKVGQPTPENFHSFTRGYFKSEAAAIKAAQKRGAEAVVSYSPANPCYEQAWYVGYLKEVG